MFGPASQLTGDNHQDVELDLVLFQQLGSFHRSGIGALALGIDPVQIVNVLIPVSVTVRPGTCVGPEKRTSRRRGACRWLNGVVDHQ